MCSVKLYFVFELSKHSSTADLFNNIYTHTLPNEKPWELEFCVEDE